jgi:RsiW-degrading membrane proteinase PrsW (M82 family)
MRNRRVIAALILLMLTVSVVLLLDHFVHCDGNDSGCWICLILMSLLSPAVAMLLWYHLRLLFVLRASSESQISQSLLEYSSRAPPPVSPHWV